MLQPLFDRYCNHVAWLSRDQFLFDPGMKWLAFIDNNNVWNKENLEWLGIINGAICLDKEGKVIAWGIGQRIMGDPNPAKKPRKVPKVPGEPIGLLRQLIPSPLLPAAPSREWSEKTFEQWVAG